MAKLHPLQIDLILDQVFQHLDLEDLKICRLVCSKWEETSRSLFMKESTICISNEAQNEKDMNKFSKDFSTDSIEWRFTKFNFEGEFVDDDLDVFIESRANILEAIKLKNIVTLNIKGDLENWIWKWNAPRLNHFEVISPYVGNPYQRRHFSVALSNIRTAKTIIFGAGLYLNIILDEKISPATLTVRSFAQFWTKDGKRLQNGFFLNEFFDIQNLVNLDFQGVRKVTVDLSESHKLEKCRFFSGRITGWNRQLKALTQLNLNCEHFDPMAVPTSVKHLSIAFQQPEAVMDLTDFLKLETLRIQNGDARGCTII